MQGFKMLRNKELESLKEKDIKIIRAYTVFIYITMVVCVYLGAKFHVLTSEFIVHFNESILSCIAYILTAFIVVYFFIYAIKLCQWQLLQNTSNKNICKYDDLIFGDTTEVETSMQYSGILYREEYPVYVKKDPKTHQATYVTYGTPVKHLIGGDYVVKDGTMYNIGVIEADNKLFKYINLKQRNDIRVNKATRVYDALSTSDFLQRGTKDMTIFVRKTHEAETLSDFTVMNAYSYKELKNAGIVRAYTRKRKRNNTEYLDIVLFDTQRKTSKMWMYSYIYNMIYSLCSTEFLLLFVCLANLYMQTIDISNIGLCIAATTCIELVLYLLADSREWLYYGVQRIKYLLKSER